jgi:hypothetical protein
VGFRLIALSTVSLRTACTLIGKNSLSDGDSTSTQDYRNGGQCRARSVGLRDLWIKRDLALHSMQPHVNSASHLGDRSHSTQIWTVRSHVRKLRQVQCTQWMVVVSMTKAFNVLLLDTAACTTWLGRIWRKKSHSSVPTSTGCAR